MNKVDLKNAEWTGVVTSFYSQYCFENRIETIEEDVYREQIVEQFREYFKKTEMNPHNLLTPKKIPFQGILNVAYRNHLFDECLRHLLAQNPDRYVVNIGCGFDTRFFRLENFYGQYWDIDFENVIAVKKELLPENPQYHMLACKDAFSVEFVQNQLPLLAENPIILCEGVFCYIPYQKLEAFLRQLFQKYPGATLICDVYLYEEHLVFSDVHSKVLLKYPEDGEKRYQKFKFWYEMAERLRLFFTGKIDASVKRMEKILLLKEVYVPDHEIFHFDEKTYTPQYWIGIYEKKRG